jgi:hypothetical protein
MALLHHRITPDIIIATDGGPWALRHIYPALRHIQKNTILAANLCAALPSQCADMPFLVINDGSFWQSVILHELKIPSVIIPQRGTVVATAAELAFMLSSGNIYLAGADFSILDIRSHVKPYSFDSLFYSCANRLTPFYSTVFKRSNLIQQGQSMDIYASWFSSQLPVWQKRIFSINKSNIFKEANPLENTETIKDNEYIKTVCLNEKPSCAIQALLSAIKNPEYAENIKQELNSLLFHGEEYINEEKIETALRKITGAK